jgi:hypothetical protein
MLGATNTRPRPGGPRGWFWLQGDSFGATDRGTEAMT